MDENTTVADAISGLTMGDLGNGLEMIGVFVIIFVVISFIGAMLTPPRF